MAVSLVLCDKLLASYFTPDQFTADEMLYVALTSTTALVNSPGNLIMEPVAAAYSRVALPRDSDHWTLSGTGDLYNIVDAVFPAPAPGEDWGLVSSWALLDAPSGGMVLASGGLVDPTYFLATMPPLAIQPGGVTVSLYSA